MRTFFQDQSIQEQIKRILVEHGCEFIVEDYWDEFLRFFTDEKNVLDDLPDFLDEQYLLDGDELIDLVDDLSGLLSKHEGQLKDLFRYKSDEEVLREQNAEEVGGTDETTKSLRAMAQFYFSAEDEEEIRGIMEQGTWNKEQLDQVYDRVAEEVIDRIGMKDR